MTDPVAARHALACALAREAGALALGFFADRGALAVETKDNPQDVVSRADREVEALIRARIAAAFPDDALIGEEGGAAAGGSGFTWVVDPIDGTMPFLSGLPHWCVAIALVSDGRAAAAATFAPVTGDLFDAVRGGGARLNGAVLRVDPALGLSGRMTAIGASHRTSPGHVAATVAGLMQAGGIFYRNGSGALMLASVAAGQLAAYYEPHMNAWDCLGGFLLVEEAGGRVLPVPMAALLASGGPALAAAPAAYDDLARIAGHA
jgi:myo-inositol-1(or 4)-monophosphatase